MAESPDAARDPDDPRSGDPRSGDPRSGDPRSGDPRSGDPRPDDIAVAALQDAQVLARQRSRRGGRRPRPGAAGRSGSGADAEGRPSGYSAAGPDPDRDPQRVGDLVPGVVADLGWERPMSDARVFADWPSLVGRDVAAHCSPQSLRDGELRISAESTAWATQLRLLAATLLARLVAELGPDTVTKVVITGPVAPAQRFGPLRVRYGRGPRDTYG